MATELTRRQLAGWVSAGLLAVAAPAWAGSAPRLAASWRRPDHQHQVGWLRPDPSRGQWQVEAALDVPTRAHGVWIGAQGELFAAARRPGDWLLRWQPCRDPLWVWMPPERTLNGHVLLHPEGRVLLTTETDLDTGEGWVTVREATTLLPLQAWPTRGRDPHQLLWDRHHPDRLFVANGGIETRPETGRQKLALDTMDSSLVCLDTRRGEVLGQWRLEDARLSLRHLAWSDDRLGVALQAEHDDAAQRHAAPLLALLEPTGLRAVAFDRPLAGYGGDIAGTPEGFAVGCPRAGGVALHHRDGRPRAWVPLPEACALATDAQGRVWIGGHPGAGTGAERLTLPDLRLDNHWRLPG